MAVTMTIQESEELFLEPGDARGFAFDTPPPGFPNTAFFSQAFPSRPMGGKQSLWTIAHGIETDGVSGGEFPHHDIIVHWVTVQVADPQIPTAFTIQTVVISP